ncbi:TetR family transcriptional regulator [Devosia sp.]|uniref:TetR family transcriptional regulator n=1 Tax=Devosia sp. TaxID=1871048 RepID=UPI003BAC17E3
MTQTQEFQRARKPQEIEARRTTLLTSAAELFDAEGPQGAGLNAIAARAGFTKSNVYRYFESREQVLLELFLGEMASLVPTMCDRLGTAAENDVPAIADLIAGEFTARPRLGQLTAILTSVLEANVSEDTIVRTKRTMGALTARLAEALHQKLPKASVADCLWAISMIGTLVAGMWPAARPSPAAARVLEREEFAAFRPNIQRDLKRAAEALLASIV